MCSSIAIKKTLFLTGLCALLASPLNALACWEQAAQRYGVPAQLLVAIARVESNLNPHAVNHSHFQQSGSYDIGIMQINSSNLPKLARYGIREADLFNTCINIHVGAWLLANSFELNGVTWDGVGAYNAACTRLKGEDCRRARIRYAWLVYRQLTSRHSTQRQVDTANVPPTAPLVLTARVSP